MNWSDDWASIQQRAAQAAAADARAQRAKAQNTARAQGKTDEARERAILTAMVNFPLKPGQMLLVGPKSVAIMAGEGTFTGRLPDTYVIDRSEWADLTGTAGRGKMRR